MSEKNEFIKNEEGLGEAIVLPIGPTANLQLPDPALRSYYIDEVNRVFRIFDEVNDSTLDLVDFIIKCNLEDKNKSVQERKPIRVLINTLGGDTCVCLTVMHAIRDSKTPVWTFNMCRAYSSGGLILMSGHRRFALKGSSVVVHKGSVAIAGEVSVVASTQRFYKKVDKKIEDLMFSLTNVSKEYYNKKASSDIYYDEEECLKYGIIDEIVQSFEEVF